MNADAKREMRIDLAVEHHPVRQFKDRRVPISGRERDQDHFASTSVFDLPTTLSAVANDPEVLKAAAAIAAEVNAKLPEGLGLSNTQEDTGLAALLDEAQTLLLGRTSPSTN